MNISSVILTAFASVFLANQPANKLETVDPYIASLNAALETVREDGCKEGLAVLIPATEDDGFADLTNDSKALVYGTIIDCTLDERMWPDALTFTDKLIELRGETSRLLWIKLHLGDITDKPLHSLRAAESLARLDPQTLSQLDLRTVWRIIRKLQLTVLGDKRLEFISALREAEYAPPDPTASLDGLRMFYARLLRDELMTAKAATVIREMTNPILLAQFFYDRRFDSVSNFRDMPVLDDMPQMLDQFVSEREAMMAAHPKKLSAALGFVQALRVAGEFERAYEVGEQIAENMGVNAAASPFEDFDEQANWLLNELGYALYDLGRRAEARDMLERAAALNEDGVDNVSQLINLSSLLVSEGQFKDALAEIAKLNDDNASPYGVMWAQSVEVRARAMASPASDFSPYLDYMKEHKDDNVSALSRAFLCVNDLDSAAALYIERLNDLETRDDALSALQITLDPPHRLPVNLELQRRFDIVRGREDVTAAANKVGRILTLPIYSTYWGDI